jgi:hypothetical protein
MYKSQLIHHLCYPHLMSSNSAVDGRSTELPLVLSIISCGINCAELSCYATRELVSYKRWSLATSLFECVCCYVRKHAGKIRMLTKAVISLLLCVTLQLFCSIRGLSKKKQNFLFKTFIDKLTT